LLARRGWAHVAVPADPPCVRSRFAFGLFIFTYYTGFAAPCA
jgi:hypothetical protein